MMTRKAPYQMDQILGMLAQSSLDVKKMREEMREECETSKYDINRLYPSMPNLEQRFQDSLKDLENIRQKSDTSQKRQTALKGDDDAVLRSHLNSHHFFLNPNKKSCLNTDYSGFCSESERKSE
jgi:hypothetical protein